MPNPAAHTRLPLSTPPATPRSSQCHAPGRCLPARPASLPGLADNAPTDLPAGSTPHSSGSGPGTSQPPLPASTSPAPQTVRECICLADTPPPLHSMCRALSAALLPAAPAGFLLRSPERSLMRSPTIAAPYASTRTPAADQSGLLPERSGSALGLNH